MFKKNWITTVAGQILGILNAYIMTVADGTMLSFKGLAAYAVPAIIGLFSKDFNTTGVGATATKPS